MTPQNQDAIAREEIDRGNEALVAAEELLKLRLHNDAISRTYYAAYHWARAVLFTKGLESKTHRGTNQLLGLHFVREGALSQEAARLLAQLQDLREASDYTASVRFTEEEARDAVAQTRAFIALCRPLLTRIGGSAPGRGDGETGSL